jgi:hypothetical protein
MIIASITLFIIFFVLAFFIQHEAVGWNDSLLKQIINTLMILAYFLVCFGLCYLGCIFLQYSINNWW